MYSHILRLTALHRVQSAAYTDHSLQIRRLNSHIFKTRRQSHLVLNMRVVLFEEFSNNAILMEGRAYEDRSVSVEKGGG
jgi:hypothetical protein